MITKSFQSCLTTAAFKKSRPDLPALNTAENPADFLVALWRNDNHEENAEELKYQFASKTVNENSNGIQMNH